MPLTQKICQNQKVKHDVKPLSAAVPKGKAAFFVGKIRHTTTISAREKQGQTTTALRFDFKKSKSEVDGDGF